MSYRTKDEPRKLASVLRKMVECGPSPDDLWQTEQPDGDPFVARAAELLEEQETQLEMLTRLVDSLGVQVQREKQQRHDAPAQAASGGEAVAPELTSGPINDACWAFVEAMPCELPGPIWNNLKRAVHAAVCKWLEAQRATPASAPPAGDPPAPAAAREVVEVDVLLRVIQRLNGNPYSLTKRECISEVEKMRDAALAAADAQRAQEGAR